MPCRSQDRKLKPVARCLLFSCHTARLLLPLEGDLITLVHILKLHFSWKVCMLVLYPVAIIPSLGVSLALFLGIRHVSSEEMRVASR
jgi:hypothetical protein